MSSKHQSVADIKGETFGRNGSQEDNEMGFDNVLANELNDYQFDESLTLNVIDDDIGPLLEIAPQEHNHLIETDDTRQGSHTENHLGFGQLWAQELNQIDVPNNDNNGIDDINEIFDSYEYMDSLPTDDFSESFDNLLQYFMSDSTANTSQQNTSNASEETHMTGGEQPHNPIVSPQIESALELESNENTESMASNSSTDIPEDNKEVRDLKRKRGRPSLEEKGMTDDQIKRRRLNQNKTAQQKRRDTKKLSESSTFVITDSTHIRTITEGQYTVFVHMLSKLKSAKFDGSHESHIDFLLDLMGQLPITPI